jgi:hypothetical protein
MSNMSTEDLLQRMMAMSEHDLSELTAAVRSASVGDTSFMVTVAGTTKDILWHHLAQIGWLAIETGVEIDKMNQFKIHPSGIIPLKNLTTELYAAYQRRILRDIDQQLKGKNSKERRFKLLVPSNSPGIGISGRVGSVPDTGILSGANHGCARSCLPRYIDDLIFTAAPKELRNFYIAQESSGYFFIVSHGLKEFLRQKFSSCDIEIASVRLRHKNGTSVEEPYFAIKILKTIDCIDAENSIGRQAIWGDDRLPFNKCTVSYELGESVAADFANVDQTKYVSYPSSTSQIFNVSLRHSVIAPQDYLFYPKLWPGFLVIDETFGRALEQLCFGGNPGYYFWMLDLNNVCESHNQLQIALR